MALSAVGLLSIGEALTQRQALASGPNATAPSRPVRASKTQPAPKDKPKAATKAGAGKSKGSDKTNGRGKKSKKRGSGDTDVKHHTPSLTLLKRKISCPDDMVAVAGRVCVDRYESTLVEQQNEEIVSPYYPPGPRGTAWSFEKWTTAREEAAEGSLARELPLPEVPEFQRSPFKVKAMSWPSSLPNGYVSGEAAVDACRASGKRLCSEEEWVTACRGETQTQFPYGNSYRQDTCNVFRDVHPATILHGVPSEGHSDPRLNRLTDAADKPLLLSTGSLPSCVSRWGDDAIYDMVGNLDEWIDDPDGTFVGGFYARSTRNGCDARVRNHPVNYFDYSTGVRCCRDPD